MTGHATRRPHPRALRPWRAWATRIFGGLSPAQVASIALVPLLLMGVFTAAFHDPMAHLHEVPAAVVNEDDPVTVDGQVTPLGRTLAGSLVNSDDPNYDWTLTNADDATQGLASGHYRVVVTIPKTFSKVATSAATAKPADAAAGTITIRSTDDAPLVDAMVGRVLADAARRSLGTQITETYLSNVLEGLTTMHTKLADASSGANKLATGADQLSTGTGRLSKGAADLDGGLTSLDQGADQLSTGSGSLASGAHQSAQGAAQLAAGTDQLSTGATSLDDGLSTLRSKTSSLPGSTRRLATGARQVADGTQQLRDRTSAVSRAALSALDSAPPATDLSTRATINAAACDGSPAFCARLRDDARQMTAQARRIEQAKSTARAKITSSQSDIDRLDTGAHQVADGNEQLAAATPALADGIAQAQSGAHQLRTGAVSLDSGARQLQAGTTKLASGADRLHDGAQRLATGVDKAKAGADSLASGAKQADGGAKDLASGNRRLADGLTQSLSQVPTYTPADRDHLEKIVAAPVATDVIGTDGYMNSAFALFAVLSLWCAALIAFVVLRAIPRRVTTSAAPSWYLAWVASRRAVVIGVVHAVLVAGAIAAVSNCSAASLGLLIVAGLVTAATFLALNQAAVAMGEAGGRPVSLAVLLLTLATGVTSAQPGVLRTLGAALPTAPALDMYRHAVAGDAAATLGAALPLLLWWVAAVVVILVAMERARTTTVRDLVTNRPRRAAHQA